MMISLAPPRKPSGSRIERNWTIVIARPGRAEHVALYGTRAGAPEGAQEAANAHLGANYAWIPRGTGYQAEEQSK